MRLLIETGTARYETEMLRAPSTATLADLLDEVTGVRPAPSETWFVDQARHRADDLLSDVRLLEASVVAREPRPVPSMPQGWSARLAGGLTAGALAPVPPNRPLVVGRAPQADLRLDTPSASWQHFLVAHTVVEDGSGRVEAVRVTDDGSTNGTLVDGQRVPRSQDEPAAEPEQRRLRLRRDEEPEPVEPGLVVTRPAMVTAGGATVALDPGWPEQAAPAPGSLDNQTPAGTVPFNRPPRVGRRPAPDLIATPKPQTISRASRFSWIAILAPLAMAGAMVAVMGNARYALIAGLTPVMAIGSWLEQRQRATREETDEKKRFDDALVALRTKLERANDQERERLLDDLPDPATVVLRADLPTTRLWERRMGTDAFLALHVGIGDAIWAPPLDDPMPRLDERVRSMVTDWRIPSAPVAVDLTGAGVVGVVGDREGALAVARSLAVQAAVHCGPADLTVAVCCDPGRGGQWEWASWLPHTRRLGTTGGDRWTSAERGRSDSLLRTVREGVDEWPTPALLLVLDSDVLTEGRESVARQLLGHARPVPGQAQPPEGVQVSGIVVASSVEQLPASCTVVVEVGADARGTVTRPALRERVEDVVLAGLDVETAARTARDLARFEDPELVVPGASLPSLVRMPPLFELDRFTSESIQQLWTTAKGFRAPIGVGEHGAMSLDLVKDGPHGLVGGTTGSGKSEFLRSLVAGLAANNDPTRLNFLLIDFKGGAAFAACERLPHTIGTVSNLDEQLADRALRALEAEMNRRMVLFSQAGEGIDNLDAYLATGPAEAMPRLLLVVDEFAMLAKDYPDVLSALVSVAAVGRTLGVHMVLATQRPAGVVNDDILANTNLRVALRVQSRDDSTSVIGVPGAAAIGRGQQGRAFIKLGQDDITPVQTALVTGFSESDVAQGVQVRPMTFGAPVAPPARPRPVSQATDLDELIDAIIEANDALGFAPPRTVWPEALGERVGLTGFTAPDAGVPVVGGFDGSSVRFAVADDPDRQRQIPVGWDLDRGNLLLMGIPGSGTTTTLASVALALAANTAPADLDLMVLDMGSRDLEPLAALPHTVAYVPSGSAAREMQVRLLRTVRAELDTRRANGGGRRMVVLIDGLAALRDEFTDFEGLALLDGLYRAYADGPDLGLHFAVSTSRAKAVPPPMEDVTTQRWLFRLADPYDYSLAGLKPADAPADVPGRTVLGELKLQAHVATASAPLPEAVAQVSRQWGGAAKDSVVGQLPSVVAASSLGLAASVAGEPWRIPLGIAESDLEPAWLELYEGEHALVAGPARSGKSSALVGIAQVLRASAEAPLVWGVCSRRSPLASAGLDEVAVGPTEVAALVARVRLETRPLVLLVDDAESFDDSDQSLAGLVAQAPTTVHVIAAGRSDDLRSLYSHWTKAVRKSRAGMLLQPNVDYDGELLGVTLPRRTPVQMTVGRGYLCGSGQARLVQAIGPAQP